MTPFGAYWPQAETDRIAVTRPVAPATDWQAEAERLTIANRRLEKQALALAKQLAAAEDAARDAAAEVTRLNAALTDLNTARHAERQRLARMTAESERMGVLKLMHLDGAAVIYTTTRDDPHVAQSDDDGDWLERQICADELRLQSTAQGEE